VISLVIAAVALWALLRNRSDDDPDRSFLGILLTSIIVSPLGWLYYLWLAAGPATAIYLCAWSRASTLSRALAVCALPGLLLPVRAIESFGASPAAGLTVGSIFGWTLLVLWFSVIVDVPASGQGMLAAISGARSARAPRSVR
jgi:hypothetical protein